MNHVPDDPSTLLQMQPYPEWRRRAQGFPSTWQGRDGEEGDWAHGLWRAEDHLRGLPGFLRWPRAQLGRWEQHPQWPHSYLCCWDRGPCQTRGRWNRKSGPTEVSITSTKEKKHCTWVTSPFFSPLECSFVTCKTELLSILPQECLTSSSKLFHPR